MRVFRWSGLLGFVVLLSGCAPAVESTKIPEPPATSAVVERSEPSRQPAAADPHQWETWDALYMSDAKIGYMHTRSQLVEEQNRQRVEIESHLEMTAQRFGDRTTQTMTFTSLEDPQGALLGFTAHLQLGNAPMVVTGRYEQGQLQIEMQTASKTQSSHIEWQPEWGGLFAAEQSLRRDPLQPGETRILQHLKAPAFVLGETRLSGEYFESTRLLDGSKQLLRIRSIEQIGDVRIESILWMDQQGLVWKQSLPGLNQVTYRTTADQARTPSEGADLGQRLIVPVERAIEQPHETVRAVYEARLANSNPAELFPSGLSQSVSPIDSQTVRLEIQAVRPDWPEQSSERDAPTPEALEPTNFIQSDDPQVVALAEQAAADLTGWELARRLEQFVYEHIEERNFSQALATASEVATTREGDCTEHAVLLAALCRARGIPARVAMGLVYIPYQGRGGFGYHMWTEAWINGRWIGLDATLGQGGLGATHIKLSDSTLKGPAAFLSYLQLHQVLGQLELKVLEVDPGSSHSGGA